MTTGIKNWAYRLLRRGERYTGTDNVYLAKGGFWFTFAQFVASASSLILAVLFSRFVDKDAYGTYQYFLSWGSILALASLTGMSGALTRAVARGQDRSVYGALRARLRWGLLGLAAAAGIAAYYGWRGRADLSWGFLIVGAIFPANMALSSWADYAVGKKRFDVRNAYANFETIAAGAVVAAAVFLKPAPVFLAAGYGLAHFASAAFILKRLLKRLPPTGAAADVVPYGKRLSVLDVFATVANYFDRILIFALLGSRDTAVYAFAVAPPEQIKGYLKNLYFLALPKIAERPLAEIKKTFYKKILAMIGVVALITAVYVAAAPLLYRMLFPNYLEAAGLSRFYALSLAATAAVLPLAIFTGHEKFAENMRYQIVSSTVSVILMAVFVWKWGLTGAVAARVAGRFFGLGYAVLLVKKIFNESSQAPPPSRSPDFAVPAAP